MIRVRGAREHNLKGIDIDLPLGKLIVCTGVSGSGKSSLAFDTVYAEASRRFMEALAPDARAKLGRLRRPAVTFMDGLPPAIGVSQRGRVSAGPRATVASEAEIHELLRVVWATLGVLHCPTCDAPSKPAVIDAIIRELLAFHEGSRLSILAPVARARPVAALLRELPRQGFVRVRLDGIHAALDDLTGVDDRVPHDLDVVIDRLRVPDPSDLEKRARLAEALRVAQRVSSAASRGDVLVELGEPADLRLLSWGARGRCASCSTPLPELHTRLFSTSSPKGACRVCEGLGLVREVDPARLVEDPARSLAEGVVEGGRVLRDAAVKHGISLDRAWRDLPWEAQDFVLRGGPGWEGAVRRAQRRSGNPNERTALATRETVCVGCASIGLAPVGCRVRVEGQTLPELLSRPLSEIGALPLAPEVAPLVEEIARRIQFLVRVGLGHLTLGRAAATLSTGESQRVRIAAQAGNQLAGVLYVLDEPTAGLHPDDVAPLRDVMLHLRDSGNTLLVVEHDPVIIAAADLVLDMGPGAGPDGGELLYFGPPAGLTAMNSPTARWLDGRDVPNPPIPRVDRGELRLIGARGRNLGGVDLSVPLGQITAVTGRSGAGKSTLVLDTLAVAIARHLGGWAEPLPFDALHGAERITRLVRSGVATTPRSDRSLPVTLLKIWADLRGLYARLPLARQNGWGAEHWSLHTAGGGRCVVCEGEGTRHVELHYLPEVAVECEACEGRRYDEATLSVLFHGLSMADVLALPVREARVLLQHHTSIAGPLRLLEELGLGYLSLGQPASTLSGGEQQRVQLARELGRPGEVAGTLYVLDEPSIGLHPADIASLLHALHRLADAGGTVVVLDTDPALIGGCDRVVRLG